MKVLILCASRYGSTEQIGRWMKERFIYESYEVYMIKPFDEVNLANYDLIVLGSGIYSHRPLPELSSFIEKNLATLRTKRVALFGVLMKTSPVFYKGKIHGGLGHLKDTIDLLGESVIHADMLHGEMVPSKLTKEDLDAVMRFYKMLNLPERELKERLRPRTLMDKKEVWEFVEKVIAK